MDSLHPSLSQALPLRDYDAEQALQAPFRAAALGIATFYKKASENGRKAYSLGYSSALQDVLAHLQLVLISLFPSLQSGHNCFITSKKLILEKQKTKHFLFCFQDCSRSTRFTKLFSRVDGNNDSTSSRLHPSELIKKQSKE
ncbi:hypothetical protein PGTUg99_022039 [Puccinia graminis f. sp. tritici]|uniref:Uncharacterized protein n=1 Tax=Puccinia graminis f. sp. tritici TaxID=56615 RepID=A0A5B0RLV1_PUCGR|nr:hypothetical protein PGTUg99_022039 [Puccinia graminis f. sp. tritici]